MALFGTIDRQVFASATIRRATPAAALLAALTCLAFPAGGLGSAAGRPLVTSSKKPASQKVTSKAVTFAVKNVNRSNLDCFTDGASYQIKGHLVGPRSSLAPSARRKRAATLYLHGLGFGEWFWTFSAVPAYDYATAQAKRGHTSVVIDRLGYGSSGHPDGNKSCLGGQADIAHQVVQALRAGNYTVDAGKPARFKKIALAGHSIGSAIAMIEASSFRDVDALVVMSFSYQNLPKAQLALGPTRDACLAGGQPAQPGGPSGYAYYGQPAPADFQAIMFHAAIKPVLDAAIPMRSRDPCGDTNSIVLSLLRQEAALKKVKVPVLVICGTKDALYSGLGCSGERDRFVRSRSTTLELVRNAGHALTLDRPAASFRIDVSRWLAKRGL